jgi:hypothetical protein
MATFFKLREQKHIKSYISSPTLEPRALSVNYGQKRFLKSTPETVRIERRARAKPATPPVVLIEPQQHES